MKFFSKKLTPLQSGVLKTGLALGWIIFALYTPYFFSYLDVLLSPFEHGRAVIRTENDLTGLSIELWKFMEKHERFPSNQEGLGILFHPSQVQRVEGQTPNQISYPLDAWKRPYQYSFPALENEPEYFDLFSLGEDGKTGTVDDINNWDENKPWREYYRQEDWWIGMLGSFLDQYLVWILLFLLVGFYYYSDKST